MNKFVRLVLLPFLCFVTIFLFAWFLTFPFLVFINISTDIYYSILIIFSTLFSFSIFMYQKKSLQSTNVSTIIKITPYVFVLVLLLIASLLLFFLTNFKYR